MAESIITTVTTAIKGFLTGVGNAIVSFFDQVVMTAGESPELTNFATWALVFLGVGFALSVIGAILRKVG